MEAVIQEKNNAVNRRIISIDKMLNYTKVGGNERWLRFFTADIHLKMILICLQILFFFFKILIFGSRKQCLRMFKNCFNITWCLVNSGQSSAMMHGCIMFCQHWEVMLHFVLCWSPIVVQSCMFFVMTCLPLKHCVAFFIACFSCDLLYFCIHHCVCVLFHYEITDRSF